MNRYVSLVAIVVLSFCSVSQGALMDLYVSYGASSTTGGVAKYTYDTATQTATLDTGFAVNSNENGLKTPQGMAYVDNVLYVAGQDSTASSSIKMYNRFTGAYLGEALTSGTVDTPNSIAIGPDGNLYATEWTGANANVKKVDLSTGAATTFTSGSLLSSAAGLAWGSDGNLYASDVAGASSIVQKFNGTTGASIGTFASLSDNGIGIGFDSSGNLYVSGGSRTALDVYDSSGNSLGTFGSGLNGPQQFAFQDHNGDATADIFVANYFANIGVLDGSDGTALGDVVTGLTYPKAVLFAPVPEPSAMILFTCGLLGLLAYAWRKRK